MDDLLSPITHRPSLSYPPNAINPDYDRPRYFQQVSSWGNPAYNGVTRRKPGPWISKLFRPRKHDFKTLFTGSCLPCVLYGRTQYRLKQMAEGEDPLDLSQQDSCNGPCWMFGMITCCVGFDWFVVMLQHSRIRATYNIDGTAGGDCVQSLFCSRCTLMQDEWEVVTREERLLLERKDTEINRQPGQQQQMRYSTSNLFEEVPEVFRPLTVSGHKNELIPRSPTPSPGEQETNADQPLLQDVGDQDHPQSSNKGVSSYNKPRQSGHGPRKLAVRKSSPIGSALNPITRRSSSADLGGRLSDSKLPQRSATNPTRSATLVSPVRYPSPNFLSYRLRGNDTDGILDMPRGFGAIKEEAKSEDFSPSIRSDVGVKSFAMGSIYSGCSLRQGQSDARADESVIVYYGHEDRPQHHQLSDFTRSRPMTPEPNSTQVATLDGVAGRLESVDEDDRNTAECSCGLDTRHADSAQELGLIGIYDQGDGEELFAQLSTATPVLRRFSISPSEMEDISLDLQAPNSASEVARQGDGAEPLRSLGRAGSLIRYLVDIDKYLNIPTGHTKTLSNVSIGWSNDPSNDLFKSIIEGSSSDGADAGVTLTGQPTGFSDLSDKVDSDAVEGDIESVNRPVAEDGVAHETEHRLQHGESSASDFADSTSKALDSVADNWIELSSLETSPAGLGMIDLRTPEQSAHDKDLLSDECDFISAEQHMSDANDAAHETVDEGHIVPLTLEIVSGDEDSHEQERCSMLHVNTAEPMAQPDGPHGAEPTTQSGEPTTTANPFDTEVKDLTKTAINLLDPAPQVTSKDNTPVGMRRSSKKSRNRRNRKRRAAAEAARIKP